MTKVCNKCKQDLDLNLFAKQKLGVKGRRASCKQCVTNTYLRSKRGLVIKMHSNQRAKSIRRNHPQPAYTKEELYDWCIQQPIFHEMFDQWAASEYLSDNIPTCDRLDDYKPYSLDNIQLLTYLENSKKHYKDVVNGTNNKRSIAVECYNIDGTFNTEYHSISEAARAVGTTPANIRNVCEGTPLKHKNKDGSTRYYIPKKSKGFIWKYK